MITISKPKTSATTAGPPVTEAAADESSAKESGDIVNGTTIEESEAVLERPEPTANHVDGTVAVPTTETEPGELPTAGEPVDGEPLGEAVPIEHPETEEELSKAIEEFPPPIKDAPEVEDSLAVEEAPTVEDGAAVEDGPAVDDAAVEDGPAADEAEAEAPADEDKTSPSPEGVTDKESELTTTPAAPKSTPSKQDSASKSKGSVGRRFSIRRLLGIDDTPEKPSPGKSATKAVDTSIDSPTKNGSSTPRDVPAATDTQEPDAPLAAATSDDASPRSKSSHSSDESVTGQDAYSQAAVIKAFTSDEQPGVSATTGDIEEAPSSPPASPSAEKSALNRSGAQRRRSFGILGSNVGELDFNRGLSRSKSKSKGDQTADVTSGQSATDSSLNRKRSIGFRAPDSPEKDSKTSRGITFAPLGSMAGGIDLSNLPSRRKSVSRGSGDDDGEVKAADGEEASTSTGGANLVRRLSSFGPGKPKDRQADESDETSGTGGAALVRKLSAFGSAKPKDRQPDIDDGLWRRGSTKAADSTGESPSSRRRSFAPLGNSVGEFNFDRLGPKSSTNDSTDPDSNDLTRSKSVSERANRIFGETPAGNLLARARSIKIQTPDDTAARRSSFAPLGSSAGKFEFDRLPNTGLGRSSSVSEGPADSTDDSTTTDLTRKGSTSSGLGRRSSLARVLSRDSATRRGSEPKPAGPDHFLEGQFIEPSREPAQDGLQRKGSGRRLSGAPLSAMIQPIDFDRKQGTASNLFRRLSRSRSKNQGTGEVKAPAAFDEYERKQAELRKQPPTAGQDSAVVLDNEEEDAEEEDEVFGTPPLRAVQDNANEDAALPAILVLPLNGDLPEVEEEGQEDWSEPLQGVSMRRGDCADHCSISRISPFRSETGGDDGTVYRQRNSSSTKRRRLA